jgi:hypothetical protein
MKSVKTIEVLLFFIFGLHTVSCSNAQDTTQVLFRRNLAINDFRAIPDKKVPWLAYSRIGLKFLYSMPNKCVDAGKVRFKFSVNAIFEEHKSWFKSEGLSDKTLKEVLAHEQEHYNIGEIMANEIFARLSSLCYDAKNGKYEIDSIVHRMYDTYERLQKQYDSEVYGLEGVKNSQEYWTDRIHRLLIESRQKRKKYEN